MTAFAIEPAGCRIDWPDVFAAITAVTALVAAACAVRAIRQTDRTNRLVAVQWRLDRLSVYFDRLTAEPVINATRAFMSDSKRIVESAVEAVATAGPHALAQDVQRLREAATEEYIGAYTLLRRTALHAASHWRSSTEAGEPTLINCAARCADLSEALIEVLDPLEDEIVEFLLHLVASSTSTTADQKITLGCARLCRLVLYADPCVADVSTQ